MNLNKFINLKGIEREANIAEMFDEQDRQTISNRVWRGFQIDDSSRSAWLRRNEEAMNLALQITREKTSPWPGCSNVAFPLITIGALQFHSRAYSSLIQTPQNVKCQVPGVDPQGKFAELADRVGRYRSYQTLVEDESWEEQHDRLLLVVPIVGCAFIKTRRTDNRNVSELILPRDLVINYYAKSVEESSRKTQILTLSKNDVYERVLGGLFCNVLDTPWFRNPIVYDPNKESQNRTGIRQTDAQDEDNPVSLLEQHCWLDLDGDGYSEPYIATIEHSSKQLVRLVARWNRPEDIDRTLSKRIIKIYPEEFYTKYSFIPSPDGSIYDLGFGTLLGPLNESVNSLVNILIDGGSLNVSAGAFLGSGTKIRGGQTNFSMFGWKTVDSTGDDLRKNIFPFPTKEPSQVLFSLLQLLINFTQRIPGTTDTMVGENPGQNTPKSNMDTMVEQGMKVYNAIYKRLWRSMRNEFRKLYILNARFSPAQFMFGAEQMQRSDFLHDPSKISPMADPYSVSDTLHIQKASAVTQRAMVVPGYNKELAEKEFLRAMGIQNIDALFPGPQATGPLPNPKVMIEQIKAQTRLEAVKIRQQEFVLKQYEQIRLNNAKILQLESQAKQLMAQAESTVNNDAMEAINLLVQTTQAHNEDMRKNIEALAMGMENETRGTGGMETPSNNETGTPMGGGTNPQIGNSMVPR